MPTLLLEARNIVKRFGPVTALRGVSFDLRAGEIHALCGENGAGKSTLIKTLSGIYPHGSYEGELHLDGKVLRLRQIADAERAGIGVIYQELALVPALSVAENIFLGNEPRRGPFIDWHTLWTRARELLRRFAVDIEPMATVGDLGVGRQQLVEIVKALSKESRVLILDEPTAALSESEVETLLEILTDLRARGVTCVYISHKLDEVFAVADRITVLRDGASVATLDTAATNKAEVIRLMVGREIGELFPRVVPASFSPTMEPVLAVENLSAIQPGSGVALRDISFSVRPGEVLGIGGLMGAGRTELLSHLFGAWGKRGGGRVRLLGKPMDAPTPEGAIAAGMVLVSEDRKRYGLVLNQSIGFNLSLSSLGAVRGGGGLLDASREATRNWEVFRSLRVKAPGLESVVGTLSGGNQQKVVLGKALLTGPKIIFLDEPTRGIDVGAKLEIYQLINRWTEQGLAVVLVSSELPELMGMSDRILMLHAGAVGGEFARGAATPEQLLSAAMGQPAHFV